jgi:hypothetical protein
VLLVGLYAVLFIGSLYLLRSRVRSPAARAPSGDASGSSSASSPPLTRAALLEASGMSPESRAQYFHRLSSDCCPCGCDLTLRDCLLSDEACVKSLVIAEALLRELE